MLTRLHLFTIITCLYCTQLSAVQIKGNFRIGAYSSQVSLKEEDLDQENNASVISSRLNLNLSDFNSKQDEFLIEVRDRYDFFGRSDRELLELSTKNTVKPRYFAYKRPWQKHRLYFTIGRYEPKEQGLITNDGLDIGYRTSANHRFGLFAGIADAQMITPLRRSPDPRGFNGNQAGSYWIYDTSDRNSPSSTYMTNTIAQAPSFELVDYVNRVYFYHLSLLQRGETHRWSQRLNFDLAPEVKLRQGSVRYSYYSGRNRIYGLYCRIDPESNFLSQQINYLLEASSIDCLDFEWIRRHSSLFSMEYRLGLERRAKDSKQNLDLAIGARYLGIQRGKLALAAMLGYRDNYLSDDQYIQARADYFQRKWSLHTSTDLRSRAYDDGQTIFEVETAAEIAFYFNEVWRGASSYSVINSERVEIATWFLMLGYTFGTDNTAPSRRIVPIFERVQ